MGLFLNAFEKARKRNSNFKVQMATCIANVACTTAMIVPAFPAVVVNERSFFFFKLFNPRYQHVNSPYSFHIFYMLNAGRGCINICIISGDHFLFSHALCIIDKLVI